MRRALVAYTFGVVVVTSLAVVATPNSSAQSVWSGLSYTFTKANGADPTLAANQDRITSNVWLTRDSTLGLYNIQAESFYSSFAPADTEWATDINNPGDTIAATNWANLDFTSWIDAYGGTGGGNLPGNLTSRDAVVHLLTDDVYLDLRFTSWAQGLGGGGGFSYMRAVNPVPEPSAAVLLVVGIATMSGRARRR